MKKVALITSGGDGAGINAMITMLANHKMIDLYGFHGGYDGILANDPIHLTSSYVEHRSLDGIHYLRTGRSKKPYTQEGRAQLHRTLQEQNFDCLIVCGGNGSQKAAQLLFEEGIDTIFVPMTVDNDVIGSDYSIGFDTALNQLIDLLYGFHNTATNMPGRIFMVEVLGGNSGNLAIESAVAGGADLAIIPEYDTRKSEITKVIQEKLKDKQSLIIVCSESAYEDDNYQAGEQGVSLEIASAIEQTTKIRVRKTIAGFYIRAGRPSFRDASLAAKIGASVARCIVDDRYGVMVGVNNHHVNEIPYQQLKQQINSLNLQTIEVAKQYKKIIF